MLLDLAELWIASLWNSLPRSMVARNWCQRAKVDNNYAMVENEEIRRENVLTATNQQANVVRVRVIVNHNAVV